MGDKKDLQQEDAAEKVKELAEEIGICMFCTYKDGKMKSRPMSTQKVDEDGNFWFLSKRTSDKNAELLDDSNVDLLYGNNGEKFLAVKGKATINTDPAKIKELWNPILKIWFTDGVDDPSISVIKLSFEDGYYWDVKHSRMISLAKMAWAFVTGKTNDDGIEGSLEN